MAVDYVIIFVTAPDREAAGKLAEGLVGAELAACVNILPGASSVYRWEGKIEKSDELLLLIKTRSGLVLEASEFVKKNHPYDNPESIAVPVVDGLPAYMDWIGANTIIAKDVPKWGAGEPF